MSSFSTCILIFKSVFVLLDSSPWLHRDGWTIEGQRCPGSCLFVCQWCICHLCLGKSSWSRWQGEKTLPLIDLMFIQIQSNLSKWQTAWFCLLSYWESLLSIRCGCWLTPLELSHRWDYGSELIPVLSFNHQIKQWVLVSASYGTPMCCSHNFQTDKWQIWFFKT